MTGPLERLRAGALPAWVVGVAIAVAVAVAYLAGLPALRGAEGRALDWLFAHGRIDPPEPSDRIVHLDIDDSALDTVGRWPWPRERLADAVRAIDRLGARVIAMDLLLVDPSRVDYLENGTKIDHDALFNDALENATARTVLAVKGAEEGMRLSTLWTTEFGREKWENVLARVRKDINIDRDTLVRDANLSGARAVRVRERIRAIKQIVVDRVAAELAASGTLDDKAMRKELLPPAKEARLGVFPEMFLIRSAVARQQAVSAIEARLPAADPNLDYIGIDDILPPLTSFAATVSTVGVSNAVQDPDGQLRRVHVRWERQGKIYLQFGAAAAAEYLGVDRDALPRRPLEIAAGGTRFYLDEDEMLFSWPRIDTENPILGLAPHISLGRVIDLLRAERQLERTRFDKEELTREFLRTFFKDEVDPASYDDPRLRPAIEAEVADQASFTVDGGEPSRDEYEDQGEYDLDRSKFVLAKRWVHTTDEVKRAGVELERVRAELGAALQDKLVFIGWNATGNFGDFFPTAAHERTPGVVLHGVVANSFLTGYVVSRAPRWVAGLVTIALGVAASLVTAWAGPFLAFLTTLVLLVVFLAVNTLLVFGQAHVFSAVVTPSAGLLAAWAATVSMRAVKELREKAQLRRQFGARISKRLFDFLLEHPDQVHLEGEEREVTCFFSDLAGFTSISEQLDSRTTVALLNQYMWAMNDELTKLSAYVNKFLGDGIMAVWGAFVAESPHAERACRAALACVRRLEQLNKRPEYRDLPKLSMRIGIATGVVTVGDCGAPPDLRDYTVIGDSANLAARLESANKQFGTRILVNGRTHELCPREIVTRPLGRITVVGQQIPTDIHEVVALKDSATPEELDLVEKTKRAVGLFQESKFDEAQAAWHELLEAHGDSALARLYLTEIAIRLKHPDELFDGVLRLTSK